MKNMIAVTKKDRENNELLVIENANKTAMAEVAKMLSTINLES